MSAKALPPGVDRLASGRYRARCACNGRRESKTFTNPEAASRWRLDALDAMRAGRDTPGPRPRPVQSARALTVLDATLALGRGLEAGTVRNRNGSLYKPSVSRRMESALRQHVVTRIGAVPVTSLTRRDIQRLVDEVAAEKTPETARKAVNSLAVALRLAERDGVIERNPVYGIRVPKNDEGEKPIRFLTPAEADAVMVAAAEEDRARQRSLAVPLIGLALGSGMRLGELLAQCWGPFDEDDQGLDLEGGVVRVRWSLDRVRGEDGLFPMVAPKSRAGRRDIPLGPQDVALLRRHFLASGRPAVGTLVFSDAAGALNANGAVRRTWERVVAAARIPVAGEDQPASLPEPLPTFHATRHTWCVAMLRAGVRPEAIAKLGGWSDVGIIHRRYGRHALPDELAGSGEALERYRASVRRG